jgi:hypothetical protein
MASRATLDGVDAELEQWRARAIPDVAAPLDADDVARLVRDLFASLDVDADAGENFSVNTVHYYRRKDILDEPEGRTSAARYATRHIWQAAGARLAGSLGLVTLAEAREAFRGASESALKKFVAARVADARGRQAARETISPTPAAVRARPLGRSTAKAAKAKALGATIVPLGDNAMCLIPSSHPALHSRSAARTLVDALAAALGLDS